MKEKQNGDTPGDSGIRRDSKDTKAVWAEIVHERGTAVLKELLDHEDPRVKARALEIGSRPVLPTQQEINYVEDRSIPTALARVFVKFEGQILDRETSAEIVDELAKELNLK